MKRRCTSTTLKHSCKSVAQIQQLHAQSITRGNVFLLLPQIFHSCVFSASHVSSNSMIDYSTNIFNHIQNPSSLDYNAIIRVHTLLRSPHTALAFLTRMRRNSVPPDFRTFPYVLKACGMLQKQNSLSHARTLHAHVLKFGFLEDVFACNALSCAYSRGGDINGAYAVFEGSPFRDVVSYNVMIDGFVKAGWIDHARKLFDEMPQRDAVSYNVMIDGFVKAGGIDHARKLFDEMPQRDAVSYNVMIDGFVKAGGIDHARKLFDEMPQRDAVSWGTLLVGYAKLNRCVDVIELFDLMIDSRVKFDNVALVLALSACSQLGKASKGKEIHKYIERNAVKLDSYLGSALVDLYSKCGCIETAKDVFESCHAKNVSVWNAMLMGLAIHGDGTSLLQYFSKMVKEGISPDGVTILAVLVGCSHSGLTNEAKRIFTEMQSVYGVERELKHYGCMADLLARAGQIKEAMEMIEKMPMGGDVFVWGGLLGGCKIHGNLEIAEEAAKQVMQVKPEDGGVYSVLAHMYANSQRWDDLVKVRRLGDCRWGIRKSAAVSLIELDGVMHEFVSGDCLHPYTEEICFILNGLELQQCQVFSWQQMLH